MRSAERWCAMTRAVGDHADKGVAGPHLLLEVHRVRGRRGQPPHPPPGDAVRGDEEERGAEDEEDGRCSGGGRWGQGEK